MRQNSVDMKNDNVSEQDLNKTRHLDKNHPLFLGGLAASETCSQKRVNKEEVKGQWATGVSFGVGKQLPETRLKSAGH